MFHKTGLIGLLEATFACQTFQGCFALLNMLYLLFLTEDKTICKITAGWTGKQIRCLKKAENYNQNSSASNYVIWGFFTRPLSI